MIACNHNTSIFTLLKHGCHQTLVLQEKGDRLCVCEDHPHEHFALLVKLDEMHYISKLYDFVPLKHAIKI